MEELTLRVSSFKKMKLDDKDKIVRYYCYAEIHEIPKVLSEFNTHRNEPDGGEEEESSALNLMLKSPHRFHLMTKPITVLASKVHYDNRRKIVTVILSEANDDGVYRGGALLDIIFLHRNEDECQRWIYVELELLTGIEPDMMEQIAYQRSL